MAKGERAGALLPGAAMEMAGEGGSGRGVGGGSGAVGCGRAAVAGSRMRVSSTWAAVGRCAGSSDRPASEGDG